MTPTRSLGDYHLKFPADDLLPGSSSGESLATHRPDVKVYTLSSSDCFLVLGTDGFWNEMSSADVAQTFASNKQKLKNINELYFLISFLGFSLRQ